MISLTQLREFEDTCLKLLSKDLSVKQVIVRNPHKSNHKPASTWHETQSYYYMPLITEAYYRAQGKNVPQEILNMSGRVTLLRRNSEYDIIVIPKYYTDEGYEELVQSIIKYLKQSDNLNKLHKYYEQDKKPNGNYEGHISGPKQVEILEGAGITFIVESMIRIHFK